jgi:hypothetical protein
MQSWLHVAGPSEDVARVGKDVLTKYPALELENVDVQKETLWMKAPMNVLVPVFEDVSTTPTLKATIQRERPVVKAPTPPRAPMRLKMCRSEKGMVILTPPPVAVSVQNHERRIAALETLVRQLNKKTKLRLQHVPPTQEPPPRRSPRVLQKAAPVEPAEEVVVVGTNAKKSEDPSGCWCEFRLVPANDELALQFVCKSFAASKALLTAAVEICEDTTTRGTARASGGSIFATHVRVTHDISGTLLSKRVIIYGPSYHVSLKKDSRATEMETVKLHANWCLFSAYVALVRLLRMDAASRGLLSAEYLGSAFDQDPAWTDVFPAAQGIVLPEGVTLLTDYNFLTTAARVKPHLEPCLDVIVAFQNALIKAEPMEPRADGCAFCGNDLFGDTRAAAICEKTHASCSTCRARWAFVCKEFFSDPCGLEVPPCPCCQERASKRARVTLT